MSNVKKIIKNLLVEVAGISFEVRKWSQILEDRVREVYAEEKKKLEDERPKTKTSSWGGSYWGDDVEITEPKKEPEPEIDNYGSEFTHFKYEDLSQGDEGITDTAYIYADELYITPDAMDDCPGINKGISGVLLKVDLDGEGGIDVEAAQGSTMDASFEVCVIELVEDHMVMGNSFYDINYKILYAEREEESPDWGFPYYSKKDKKWGDYSSGGYGGYGGYGGFYATTPTIEKIEINGEDYPDAYKDFKVDKWIITDSYRTEYDHWKSGYDDEGKYIVYLNMGIDSTFGGSALTHEIKHAYDDWNRMRHGGKPIRDSWEIKNIYTKDFEKLVLGGSFNLNQMLASIIKYYYLGSNLETPAYLENEYDNVSFMGNYRETAKKMMKFKASNFTDKRGNPAKGLQQSWNKLIKEYDIPLFRKFENVLDFLKYTEKYFNKRGKNILRRIDKMRYVHDKPAPEPVKSWYDKPGKYDKYFKDKRWTSDKNKDDDDTDDSNQLKLPF